MPLEVRDVVVEHRLGCVGVFASRQVDEPEGRDGGGLHGRRGVPNVAPMHVFGVDGALDGVEFCSHLKVTGRHRHQFLVLGQGERHGLCDECGDENHADQTQ